jgi:hypothetical protein
MYSFPNIGKSPIEIGAGQSNIVLIGVF